MLIPKRKRFDSTVTKAVVKVGDGRGFIIGHRVELRDFRGKRVFLNRRLVVTAAHCLPLFPPCFAASYLHERTYKNLLGALDAHKPNVWAECLFVDPVADVAVLGSPDGQELYEQSEAYEGLTDEAPALRIGKAFREGPAWVLSLDGRWRPCIVMHRGGRLMFKNPSVLIKGGMSGSPILDDNAAAIGVVCLGTDRDVSGPNPRLEHDLPGWVLRQPRYGRNESRRFVDSSS